MALLTSFDSKSQSEEILLRLRDRISQNRHDSIYYELFKTYRLSDIHKAKHYAKKASDFSGTYGNFLIQAKALRGLGLIYGKSGNFDSASISYHRAIQLCILYNYTDRLIDVYNDLGRLHERLDVYDSALHYFTLSYTLAKSNNSFKVQAIASYNIGQVHSNLQNYTEAIRFTQEAIDIENEHGIVDGFNDNHINFARILNEQGHPNNAIEHLKKVELNCAKGCDANTLAGLYFNLGFASRTKGMIEQSFDYFVKALGFARKGDDGQWLSNTLFELSFFSVARGNYEEASQYLTEAEKIATEISHKRLLRDIYYQFSVLYGETNEPTRALEYQTLYIQLNEKIFNRRVANNLKKIELTEQRKQSDSVILGKEIELLKSHILVIVSGVCILLALVIIYLVYRSLRNTRNHKVEMQNQVLSMLDDRENWKRELFRAKMELISLQNRVSGFLTGPVATLSGLSSILEKALTLEEMKEVGNRLGELCSDITVVLNNMAEIIILKNQEVEPGVIELENFKEDINTNFKKQNKFLLLNITIKPSVEKVLWTDKAFLLTILNNGISYFDHSRENPVIEVIFEQYSADGITQITIKHHSTNNRAIPSKNQLNHLAVMVAAGKLNGDILLGEYADHTRLQIYIPTVFFDVVNKPFNRSIFLE